jgi:hypothetical protein
MENFELNLEQYNNKKSLGNNFANSNGINNNDYYREEFKGITDIYI